MLKITYLLLIKHASDELLIFAFYIYRTELSDSGLSLIEFTQFVEIPNAKKVSLILFLSKQLSFSYALIEETSITDNLQNILK